MKEVSISVPYEAGALNAAATMFRSLAIALEGKPQHLSEVLNDGEPLTADPYGPVVETTADVFSQAPAGNEPPPPPVAPVATESSPAQTPPPPQEPVAQINTVPAVAPVANNGVEVDAEGLPWDARIHGSSKLKLKKEQTWKLKRGVDDALVEQVKNELRQAMAVPSAATHGTSSNATTVAPSPEPTIAPTPANEPPPPAPVTAPVQQQPAPTQTPPPPAPATGGITTLPELMGRITSSGVDQAVVLQACQAQGLQSVALLGARPDLIPAVAAQLFPGG